MDMRQAAEFFKNRWKWRKDPEWYREEQAKRLERQKAAVAARRAQKPDSDDGSSESTNPKKGGQQGPKQPSNGPQPGKQQPQNTPKSKREQELNDRQQQVIDLYLQQVLETLGKVEQSPAVQKMQQDTLELLRVKDVEPQRLLDYGRELAKLEAANKPVRDKLEATRKEARTGGNRDVWEKVDKELKHLEQLERKGQRLEFSDNLAGTTLGILDAFLGPAGPLFKTARDLYKEYKDDAKGMLVKFGRVPKFVRDKFTKIKGIWGKRDSLFKRLFPRFSAALDKFGGKLKEMGGSLLDKLSGGMGKKGKLGKLIGGAKMVGSFLSTDIGKAASIAGIAGLFSMFGKKESADKGHQSNKDGKPDKESAFSIESISAGLSKAGGMVTGLFGDLSSWISNGWQQLSSWASGAYGGLVDSFRMAELKVRILKDDIEEGRDKLWDSMTTWFNQVWEKIKNLLPDSVRKGGAYVADKIGQAVDWTAKKAGQATTWVKDQLGIKSDPAGADGTSKPDSIKVKQVGDPESGKKAVKVLSGVDLSGMNSALMNNFYAMAGEYNRLTGKNVQINSAFRSKEKQAQLKAANPSKAAAPGYSMHEYGLAIDINSADANAMESMGLFKKFGFVRPVSGEAWHVEPIAIQGMKSAIRKGKADVDSDIASSGSASGAAQAKTETEGQTPGQKQAQAKKQEATVTSVAQQGAKAQSSATDAVTPPAANPMSGLVGADKTKQTAPSSNVTSVPTQTAQAGGSSKDPIATALMSMDTKSAVQPTVSMPTQPFVDSSTSSKSVVAQSVAPQSDGAYNRVESRSKLIEKTVTPENTGTATNGRDTYQTGANNVPLYLGDMGMLTLNLGIGA